MPNVTNTPWGTTTVTTGSVTIAAGSGGGPVPSVFYDPFPASPSAPSPITSPSPINLDTLIRESLRSMGASNTTLGTKGDIGIELEAEGDLGLMPTNPIWKAEPDGSLRNGGMEYILKKPVLIADVNAAMDLFENFTKEFKFAESPRTSCHVHVNVQPFTFKEVYTVIGAYWLFEDILVEYCGASRVSNLFCLRATDASEIVHNVVNSIKRTMTQYGHSFVMDFNNDSHKYAALNLASLQRFGSIEFRSMRGIYTKKDVTEWSTMLHTFVHNARKIGSPIKMFQLFKDASLKELVDVMFGDYAEVITSQTGWKDSIKKNSHFLAQLAWMTTRAEKGEFVRTDKLVRMKVNYGVTLNTLAQTPNVPSVPKYSTYVTDTNQDLTPDGETLLEIYSVMSYLSEYTSVAY